MARCVPPRMGANVRPTTAHAKIWLTSSTAQEKMHIVRFRITETLVNAFFFIDEIVFPSGIAPIPLPLYQISTVEHFSNAPWTPAGAAPTHRIAHQYGTQLRRANKPFPTEHSLCVVNHIAVEPTRVVPKSGHGPLESGLHT